MFSSKICDCGLLLSCVGNNDETAADEPVHVSLLFCHLTL